jgi:beta-lactamase class A
MASTPYDFVSFYSRALQGKFFSNAATLNEFLAILSRADAIRDVIPLGASAFVKGGAIDVNPFHALSLAGGVYMSGAGCTSHSYLIGISPKIRPRKCR